jgi:hypothetical protein
MLTLLTTALLALLAWAEHGFQPRFLLLAGLCCGLAYLITEVAARQPKQ